MTGCAQHPDFLDKFLEMRLLVMPGMGFFGNKTFGKKERVLGFVMRNKFEKEAAFFFPAFSRVVRRD